MSLNIPSNISDPKVTNTVVWLLALLIFKKGTICVVSLGMLSSKAHEPTYLDLEFNFCLTTGDTNFSFTQCIYGVNSGNCWYYGILMLNWSATPYISHCDMYFLHSLILCKLLFHKSFMKLVDWCLIRNGCGYMCVTKMLFLTAHKSTIGVQGVVINILTLHYFNSIKLIIFLAIIVTMLWPIVISVSKSL